MLKMKKQTFNNGVASLYHTDDEGNRIEPHYESRRFSNCVIGAKRYYAAMAANTKISRMIRIPGIIQMDVTDLVEIKEELYQIEQIQEIEDDIKITQITLKLYGRKGETIG